MSTTLGLDVGTNSIGWALIEDGKRIIRSGVRIFPIGVKEEDFLKSGTEVSKNIDRRTKRGIRRRRFRFKLRREKLNGLLEANDMLPNEEDFLTTKQLYELRAIGLNRKLTLSQFGRVLQMLNKRRGFKSNRKTLADPEKKKEEGIVKEAILKLQQEIDEAGMKTVGEYFFSLFVETDKEKNWPNKLAPIERIRNRFVGREMYEKEFDMLWAKQTEFYPDVLTQEFKNKIGAETIYYQRNLKSQKGLVGKCRFEPSKRCAPRSSNEFQEYRIWQQLWMVRFASGNRIGQELSAEEKQKACMAMMTQHKMTEAAMKKLLGIPRDEHLNDVFGAKGMLGNRTNADLLEAFGEQTFQSFSEKQRFELWHILTYTDSTERLKNIVHKKIQKNVLPPFTDKQIDNYSETNLEEGYGNLSLKALLKILPHLRKGLPLTEAIIAAGYDPAKKLIKGKVVELQKVPPLAPNELRNPIVQQMSSETFRVVNAIVKEYGKPDMIRVELARELKKPKSKREEARNANIRKRKQREEYAGFLSKQLQKKIEPHSIEVKKYELWLEMGCEDPKLDALDSFLRNGKVFDSKKYKLWLECDRISIYSGKVIPLSKLFSPEIQIEHILPYSKTMNNEFGNLCLCEGSINKEKGKQLPSEYFASKGKLEEFRRNVAHLQNEAKRRRFLMTEIPEGFLNSQLTNTSYAAREIAWRLEMLLPPIKDGDVYHRRVQVVNGQATATLRRLWGLNSILSQGDVDTKNRGDHRHHAIDAIVIACSTPALIKTLADHSKFDKMNKLENEKASVPPWKKFISGSADSIELIIVSYRNQKRLIGSKPNKTTTKDLKNYPKGYRVTKNVSIRGAMHEETYYGVIEQNSEERFVTRWPLEKFSEEKQLEKIVDKKVREVLQKRVKKYGSVKKAFEQNDKDPLLMYSKKGFKVPIRHVRVINPGEHLEEIRPGTYVETGNNYTIAIYEAPETKKRSFETISFYEATRRVLGGKPIIQKSLDNKPLLFALKQRDIVVRYDEGPDEIEWNNMEYLRERLFRIRKFDVKGIIYLDYLYVSKINDADDRNVLFFQVSPNTLNCIRVEVDTLGRIIHKEIT